MLLHFDTLYLVAVGTLNECQLSIYNNADSIDGSLKGVLKSDSGVGKIAQSMLHAGVDKSRSLLKDVLVKTHVVLGFFWGYFGILS